jgi:hypothetical protein
MPVPTLQIVPGAHDESDTQATTISVPAISLPAIGGTTSGGVVSGSVQAAVKPMVIKSIKQAGFNTLFFNEKDVEMDLFSMGVSFIDLSYVLTE